MRVASAIAAVAASAAFVVHAQEPDPAQSSNTSPANQNEHSGPQTDSRVIVGYDINPVELDVRRKNRFLVGLGSYLVNASGACNDCHTNPAHLPGGDPFQGEPEIINTAQFLAGGRPFGPIVSPNITPDEFGRPAGLTFEEFENLMRTGRDPDDASRILQVMPWNIYGKMTTLDLRAIYEYLRAIPSLPDNTASEP